MVINLRNLFTVMILIIASATNIGFAEASASWPNEPSQAALLTDLDFSTLNAPGWTCYCGDVSIVSDPSSQSPVGQWRYNIGMQAGVSPGNFYYSIPNSPRELYTGYWWKPSNPWQNEAMSNINKISYLWGPNLQNEVILEMHGPAPYSLQLVLQTNGLDNTRLGGYGDPGVRVFCCAPALTLGQWHQIEIYVKLSSSPSTPDGIVKIWVNGALAINLTSVKFNNDPWGQLSLNPTWGGMNNTKTQTDYYWFRRIHISIPTGTTSNADSPPGPPAAPRVLNVTVQ